MNEGTRWVNNTGAERVRYKMGPFGATGQPIAKVYATSPSPMTERWVWAAWPIGRALFNDDGVVPEMRRGTATTLGDALSQASTALLELGWTLPDCELTPEPRAPLPVALPACGSVDDLRARWRRR